MAVERHARLEAERVAAREPARHDARAAGLAERLPQPLRPAGRDVQLEAVLAGVAGARDEHGLALELGGDRAVVLERRDGGGEVLPVVAGALDAEALRLLQDLERVGPLDRDERDVVGLVEHVGLERRGAVAQLLGDDLAVRGVRDDHVAVLAGAVHDEVVDHAAVAREQQRVLRLPLGDRRELARERVVERVGRLGADDDDLAHVREVEEARVLTHRVVLGQVAGIAHRHLPAGEVGERRSRGAVHLIEGAASFGGAGVGGAGCVGHEFSRIARMARRCAARELPLCHGPESFASRPWGAVLSPSAGSRRRRVSVRVRLRLPSRPGSRSARSTFQSRPRHRGDAT